MPETIEQTKQRVSDQFVGRGGIHGIGLRRSQNAITVYFDPTAAIPDSPDSRPERLHVALGRVAAPFDVIWIEDEAPAARPPAARPPAAR